MPRPHVRHQEEANVSRQMDEQFAEFLNVMQEKIEEARTEDRDALWLHWDEKHSSAYSLKVVELFT